MVNTRQIPPASSSMLHSVAASLQQLANHSLTQSTPGATGRGFLPGFDGGGGSQRSLPRRQPTA
ncbi:hypothetical protein K9N68_01280 [Kovacikia minuta CCNUW1]|uniref:hypothetical protein n=1 Tax=Kovacikia minuta TaxID=2931930 RepID=UPI001CC9DD5C|nr:hypothetical protein [Kovacikia minuta]UBF26672.1 hypothetical protein K9N68_01280 [Kovacikia minuta CCNUW1]